MMKLKDKIALSCILVLLIASVGLAQVPTITSFSPTTGEVGDEVVITGTNFNTTAGSNIVYFGATRATVTTATATELTVNVPVSATYAPITVLNSSTGLLAFSQSNFTPTFFPNKNSITSADFETKVDFTASTFPVSVAIGDIYGDGKADIVVLPETASVLNIFRNTSNSGSISFDPKIDIPSVYGQTELALGDMDGDGKTDIVISSSVGQKISVFRNTSINGTASFATKVDLFTGVSPGSIAIGDLDGDGKADIAVTTRTYDSVSVYRNTGSVGTISFAPKIDLSTNRFPVKLAIGDLDGDSKVDLVVGDEIGTISIFRNTSSSGSINFATKVDLTGENCLGLAVGDLDRDGKADIIAAFSDVISIYRNISSLGIINFASRNDFTNSVGKTSVVLSDLNGDGMTDIALGGYGLISVLRNSSSVGTINIENNVEFNIVSAARNISLGDLDGDGKTDLVGPNQSHSSISVIKNNPAFATITSFTPSSGSVGSSVTITGTNFSTTPANNIVKFNGTLATITGTPTTTSIVANVPPGATPGKITVEVDGQIATSTDDFVVVDVIAPSVSSFSPADNALDIANDTDLIITFDEAIIKGTGDIIIKQDEVTTHTIPVTDASVTVSGSTVTISNPSTFNNRAVVNIEMAAGVFKDLFDNNFAGIADATTWNFKIYSPDAIINSFTPTSGAVGSEVVIDGAYFSNFETNNTVKFNGIVTNASQTSETQLTVTVPEGATSGKITVEVDGQTATSTDDFVIIPTITVESFPTTVILNENVAISIDLDNAANADAVNLHSKGITQSDASWKVTSITPSANKYSSSLNVSSLSERIGLEYYFTIDYQGGQVTSNTGTTLIVYPDGNENANIPGLSFGDQVSNYQIIAVPLELSDNTVPSVFSSLMPYDKSQWRLFDYANGDNREYSGFSTITAGKGYWLIVRNSTIINPGEGKTVSAIETSPFKITLVSGWNLIGNPYNFGISWDEVLAHNKNPTEIGELKTFSNGTLSSKIILDRYRGGFVFNSGGTTTIEIPVTRNTSLGGRKSSEELISDLSDPHWELNLDLTDGSLSNLLGGIGMHPEATLQGKDHFDEVSLPLISGMGFFEIGFDHSEYNVKFNREIVPSSEEYTWNFEVIRDNENQELNLVWDNTGFGENDKQLYLVDLNSLQVTDMRLVNNFKIGRNSKNLQVIFGNQNYVNSQIDHVLPMLGDPFPNPTFNKLTVPFNVPKGNNKTLVTFSIYNDTGSLIGNVSNSFNEGLNQFDWTFDHPGIYIIQLQIGNSLSSKKIIVK